MSDPRKADDINDPDAQNAEQDDPGNCVAQFHGGCGLRRRLRRLYYRPIFILFQLHDRCSKVRGLQRTTRGR